MPKYVVLVFIGMLVGAANAFLAIRFIGSMRARLIVSIALDIATMSLLTWFISRMHWIRPANPLEARPRRARKRGPRCPIGRPCSGIATPVS